MRATLHKGRLFLSDYAEIVSRLAEANPEAADRFCDVVEHALALLAQHPQLGTRAGFKHAPAVRKWVLPGFPNYILFYEVRNEGLVLVRLLHGARHLPPLIPKA